MSRPTPAITAVCGAHLVVLPIALAGGRGMSGARWAWSPASAVIAVGVMLLLVVTVSAMRRAT